MNNEIEIIDNTREYLDDSCFKKFIYEDKDKEY